MKFYTKKTKGFTIIELLVVIAIIGILSSIVFAAVSEARKRSRDDARKSELKSMELALRLYYEANGQYPQSGGSCASSSVWCTPGPANGGIESSGNEDSSYMTGMEPTFIGELPTDPNQENALNRGYLYRSDGTNYKLMVFGTVETKKIKTQSDDLARCADISVCNSLLRCSLADINYPTTYAVYSAGAACW